MICRNIISRAVTYIKILGFFGASKALKALICNSTTVIKIRHLNYKYPIFLRFPSSDLPTFRQIFFDKEYDFSVSKDPEVIVDAGANIGLSSVYFANKYPKAKIIAIEPEETNYLHLKKNVASYQNIVPVQAALWGHNGEIDLVDPGLGKWGFMTQNSGKSKNSNKHTYQKISAKTVDQVMREHHLRNIDILKIDIEGAEKEVFCDTSLWIGKVDSLIIELHEHMKLGCNRSFYMGSSGFCFEWLQGENVYLSRGQYIKHPER